MGTVPCSSGCPVSGTALFLRWSSDSISPVSLPVTTSNHPESDYKNKDWVFINYTYKRFEGLTARGAIPSYMKAAK